MSRTFEKALLENENVWLWSGVLNGDPAQVHVPLANRPSRYRLIAVARTADGTTFTNSITLSSEYQLQARLDAPAHLLVGDRAVLIVALTNHSGRQRMVHVETAPGSTLTLLDANAVDLTLAPGESHSLSFGVEASRTGRSEIVVTIDSAGRVQRLTAGCLVEPDAGLVLQLSGTRFGNSRQTLSLPEGSNWLPQQKTRLRLQRSLLSPEAMQERQVTSAGRTRALPDPFFVLATQNPIEQEGTYPLPEAALDRFLFLIKVDYPSAEEEAEILRRTTGSLDHPVEKVLDAEQLVRMQGLVREVPVADSVIDYAVRIARASRPDDHSPSFIRQWVTWGAGPRASQNMILASKARALIQGRFHASAEDFGAVAPSVLRHRILINFAAEAEGITPDHLVQQLLQEIQAHPSALDGNRAAGIGS